MSKLPFVSLIELIRCQFSFLVAHLKGVSTADSAAALVSVADGRHWRWGLFVPQLHS